MNMYHAPNHIPMLVAVHLHIHHIAGYSPLHKANLIACAPQSPTLVGHVRNLQPFNPHQRRSLLFIPHV
jgi:hypothetical protein